MSIRGSIGKFTASPLGRALYGPVQATVHLLRRMANPGVPVERSVKRVSYRDRTFAIQCRRWHSSESDRMAVRECFDEAQYDVPDGAQGEMVDRVYKAILQSGKKPLIVDCGANIGASTLWFSARYPQAHIVSIEPAPDNVEVLRDNVKGLDVDVRQAGIGGEDGTAWLHNPSEWGMGYRTNSSRQGFPVDILSMSTVLASKPASEFTPFVLKVDVEGAEKSLFGSHHEVLNRFPLIVMEPHDWMQPGQPTCVEFFRFHAEAGREFDMNHEIIASMSFDPGLLGGARNSAA